jgi:Cof subfamily protein (haloacid dehalogenase superfamily)
MNIKLIVTDLDNTLLRRDKTISDYTVSVFQRCRELGIKIAFATSRSEQASQRFVNRISPDYFISNGGSLLRAGHETIYSNPISASDSDNLITEFATNKDIKQITLEATNGYFNSMPIDLTWSGWVDYAHSQTVDFTVPMDYGDVYKITILADSPADVEVPVSRLKGLSVMHFTGENWYQILPKLSNKAAALIILTERFGITLSEVAAFGDDHNDIEMLRECGIGIAVSNAIDLAKDAADYICGDCDEDGVAHWLEGNVLS